MPRKQSVLVQTRAPSWRILSYICHLACLLISLRKTLANMNRNAVKFRDEDVNVRDQRDDTHGIVIAQIKFY